MHAVMHATKNKGGYKPPTSAYLNVQNAIVAFRRNGMTLDAVNAITTKGECFNNTFRFFALVRIMAIAD